MSVNLRPMGLLRAVLFTICFALPALAANISHTFELDTHSWKEKPKSINLAGAFNGWSATATPMKGDAKGVYKATVELPPGVAAYKFVADGTRWLNDPKADTALDSDDGNGGKNSGVLIGAAAPAKKAAGHTFALDTSSWAEKPKTVNLAGDFNGWNKQALAMVKKGDIWSSEVAGLSNGVHAYKFVIDGERWITDPAADKSLEADDGNGGMNSGVLIGVDPRKRPSHDNAIDIASVQHDPNSPDDLSVADAHTFRVRLRTQPDDVKSADVLVTAGGDAQTVPMVKLTGDMFTDVWAAIIVAPKAPVSYTIALHDGTATVDVGSSVLLRPTGASSPAARPIAVTMTPKFTVPQWAANAVWYQIFPERFRNGDRANDPVDGPNEHLIPWTSDWWKDQPGETPAGKDNFYNGAGNVWKRRYGGDIQGIQQELPYLKSLGINAIYLNPIFEAESMHKYDATDYVHVDQHFGVREPVPMAGETDDPATWQWSKSDKVFLDFVAEAHKQGFKVIIDGVFNHVGKPQPFFQDVLKNGKNSKYVGWFDITDDTPGAVHYNAWDGKDGALPAWKKDPTLGIVHGPREYIFAVMKRWLAPDGDPSRGVDGVRLDAAEQVPHPFWIDFRKAVKETKPDALIVGEIWNWAQDYLQGDQFDCVMNYQFAMAGYEYFVDDKKALNPTQFASRLDRLVYTYPLQIAQVQQNLYDSHDTDRFPSMFVNPDVPYDGANRLEDNGPKYKIDKPNDLQRAKFKQAVAFQMAFLGAPMIYYGDECGMWGPDDPSDRQPMIWRDLGSYADPQVKFDDELFRSYQRAIAVRAALPALSGADYQPLMNDDARGVIAFERGQPAAPVVVVINRSAAAQTVEVPIKLSRPLINWLDEKSVKMSATSSAAPTLSAVSGATTYGGGETLKLSLEPYGTAILAAAK